jgi:hypothetical protein
VSDGTPFQSSLSLGAIRAGTVASEPRYSQLSQMPSATSPMRHNHRALSIFSTSTTSTNGTQRQSQERPASLFGFRFNKKRISRDKPLNLKPLPSSLTFCFSSSGHNLVLWRKDRSSIIRINVTNQESNRLSLADIMSSTEMDHNVNIRLLAEGHEWLAVVLHANQVSFQLVFFLRNRTDPN